MLKQNKTKNIPMWNQYILIYDYITSDFEIPVSFESTNGKNAF